MTSATEMKRTLLVKPGDTIQEHIDFIGMSQAELAERMGRPKEKINDLIKGREPLTISTAFQLENVLGIPAGFWLNSEQSYRKELFELQLLEDLEKDKSWLRHFPLKVMTDLGWLPEEKGIPEKVKHLLKFFSVASIEEWENIYIKNEVSVAFRLSLAQTQSPYAISAWLRKGELQARDIALEEFDKRRFKDALQDIKALSYKKPADFSSQLQSHCARCGVALVFTPNLPKAPISGATRWFHNKPIIQLSGRFKTDDHFWFTFFHEAAHIILHGKKDIFLENAEGTELDRDKEKEANTFAARTLISDKDWNVLLENMSLTTSGIKTFASQLRISPGIIVGRLQHERRISKAAFNDLKAKIELS